MKVFKNRTTVEVEKEEVIEEEEKEKVDTTGVVENISWQSTHQNS